MASQVLQYETRAPHLRYDPDGTLHIDIPPRDWHNFLGGRSPVGWTFTALFVGVGLFGPPLIVYFFMHNSALASVAAILNIFAMSLIIAFFMQSSLVSTHLKATPNELTIERLGAGDPDRHTYRREDIELLDARIESSGQVSSFGLCIQLRRYDTYDFYFASLPEKTVREYTAAIRKVMGFESGDALGRPR